MTREKQHTTATNVQTKMQIKNKLQQIEVLFNELAEYRSELKNQKEYQYCNTEDLSSLIGFDVTKRKAVVPGQGSVSETGFYNWEHADALNIDSTDPIRSVGKRLDEMEARASQLLSDLREIKNSKLTQTASSSPFNTPGSASSLHSAQMQQYHSSPQSVAPSNKKELMSKDQFIAVCTITIIGAAAAETEERIKAGGKKRDSPLNKIDSAVTRLKAYPEYNHYFGGAAQTLKSAFKTNEFDGIVKEAKQKVEKDVEKDKKYPNGPGNNLNS